MGLHVEKPMLKLSEYTNQDSDGNAMLKAHAYQAVNDGFVAAYSTNSGAYKILAVYVGSTSDPAGAGDLIFNATSSSSGANNLVGASGVPVGKGEFFEVTYTGVDAFVIRWKSLGLTLKKPIDFN